ncbi:hypothetical protein [Carboxylicivirga linearis]|uniref:Uncharacterized protein n=1 Tax=Carboxylicivirga linearis TaxID=1628157 RepID=A0ABS5JUY4_9BACT|nr:hypothetical protein [Carboxylicivirga linearis]MBS2098171.1 hypothetical protein [Carboxylicivirga linearis]
MKDKLIYYRLLYAAIGFIITTALILAVIALPTTKLPDQAITPVWVNVFIHLLFILSIVYVIKVEQRGGQQKKELLVVTGAMIIFLGLIVSDGGFAYSNDPERITLCVSLFVCAGTDLIAGILTISARYSRKWGSTKTII